MSKGQGAFLLLFLLALFLMVIGIQGNLGLTLAILLTPSKVEINQGV